MTWQLLIAIAAGLGTVLGTLAAAEAYFSKKFVKAVKEVLRTLSIEQDIRHIKRDYQTLATTVARLQDAEAVLHGLVTDYQRLSEEVKTLQLENERNKQANIRAAGVLNALKIKITKGEAALRAMTHGASGEIVSAIFNTQTED